ncbi:MAG: biotin--[acetyl-CoA-carboxylase] ligase [Lentisphaerae bacterium]|jgi:BirA family biotin operon repressor/biotin-[acetyl-CoA-carboxylase] ligase|nr:biotin--[acetyl-CoA-carboxylase] ligase [Lentisphaerota bacterium]
MTTPDDDNFSQAQLCPGDSQPDAAAVTPWLKTTVLGRRLLFFPELASSNLTTAEHGAAGEPEGLVVVADHQVAGRGRMARTWFSPPCCNLYVTLLLRPSLSPAAIPQLAIVTAVAIRRAIREILPDLAVAIKWPNDLLVQNRKLCGILCEMTCEGQKTSHAVVGFGVNVNVDAAIWPPELRPTAVSLRSATGQIVNRAQLLAAILNHFEPLYQEWLATGNLTTIRSEWQQASALEGKTVTVTQFEQNITGKAQGITPEGALILQLQDGTEKIIHAGDAHIGTKQAQNA